jgi:glycosyltransferase involved in cell wall biosynthesis
VHVGDSPESPAGGISRVIRNHRDRNFDSVTVSVLPSYDPTATSQIARQAPSAASLVRLLRRGSVRADRAVLHVHMSNGLSLVREGAFALLGRMLGWKVCVTWHSSSGLSKGRHTGRPALRLALAPAHVVHVLSGVHAAAVPARGARVVTIPNDVQAPAGVPSPAQREHVVVFAGEVGHRKGADVLLAAWEAVSPAVKQGWRLEVFGRVAPPMASLVTGITDDSIRIHGLTPGHQVQDALLRSAVAVLPSRAEALPMFLLEAMAAGCAVVATEVGAVPPLIDDGAGILVRAGDAEALASALTALMTSLELRDRLARAARDRVLGEYSAERTTARWQALYSHLVLQDAARRPVPAAGVAAKEKSTGGH